MRTRHPIETSIDASTGRFTVCYMDDAGKEQVLSERPELPRDVAKGLIYTLMKDVQPSVLRTTMTMVATTPKPRWSSSRFSHQARKVFGW